MQIEWTLEGYEDLERLWEFLALVNLPAAEKTRQHLLIAPELLPDNPRIGERLEEYDPREVRCLIVGSYEMRYEIKGEIISIVRLWHTREDR
ncbi:MAG: type II toxin-antitoxin system RelE/ParE family toxin [Nitrosospira sp.]|nr:type II toxin-antitoxin system RelE/ParE family toxin [Nitrosospira sp.]